MPLVQLKFAAVSAPKVNTKNKASRLEVSDFIVGYFCVAEISYEKDSYKSLDRGAFCEVANHTISDLYVSNS